GVQFVRCWLHCAHLMVNGEKMSKSLGNFFTLRDLLGKGWNGRELRWVLLGCHYRQSLNFTFQGLADARTTLARLDDFLGRLREAQARPGAGVTPETAARLEQAVAEFQAGLEDDLNVSATLAGLFNLVRDLNKALDGTAFTGADAGAALATLRRLDRVLAVLDVDRAGDEAPADIRQLADARLAARKAKDFARADALRKELTARGWTVEDTAAGPRLKKTGG
ncbi:MAG: DALR domain-containing protein, partial [Lentisphaeria bacterium]